MHIRLKNYTLDFKIVSLALDNIAKEKLLSEGVSFLYLDQDKTEITLLPENIQLTQDKTVLDGIMLYNNYDVFEIWPNGVLSRKYNDKSEDNYFFITGRCNSNCIMCPSPEFSRKSNETNTLSYLMELANHIPSDVRHLTITGGEPFLMGEDIFAFFQHLKDKFARTEFLILTNGRIFALRKYLDRFCETVPCKSIVAIPVHGSCQEVHDYITRTKGSFEQTKIGIKRLLKKGIPVEIRLVVSRLNYHDFDRIAELIISEFQGISYVSIIAMEMTGTARMNLSEVWIGYKESFPFIANAIRTLINNGIDVKLYNFPLCTVERSFWTLCEKSISDNKIRFAESCDSCKFKKSCSGVFAGTLQLERNELEPIL